MPMFREYDSEKECEKIMHRVKEICKIRGISQNALANAAGISKSTVHDLLSGKNKPYVYTLFKICNALEIPIKLLLDDRLLENTEQLSIDEEELLNCYRCMSKTKIELFRIFMEMLKACDEKIMSKKFETENITTDKEN